MHDNHVAYYGASELTGHPDDKWGWAAQLALAIKNIPTGAATRSTSRRVYTDGATRYNIQDLAGRAGANTVYGTASPIAGAYQSIGFGIAPDSVFGHGTSQSLVQTWYPGAYTITSIPIGAAPSSVRSPANSLRCLGNC